VAALDWLVQRTRAEQVLLLGHSAGGQMLGLLPNHRVAQVVGVAVSRGWFGGMRPAFRLASRAVLRGVIPLGIRFKGYAPCTALRLGENLPARAALKS
jgi:predicted alpha/beta hydrolase